MLMVQCPGCMTQAFLECTCPPGHTENVGQHHPECSHHNVDASITCPPGDDCCQEDHDHAAMANSCHGNHAGVPCPEEPHACRVWKGAIADLHHPEEATRRTAAAVLDVSHEDGPPPCPGGHCHAAIPDCAVCRPLIITVLPGGTTIQPAGA